MAKNNGLGMLLLLGLGAYFLMKPTAEGLPPAANGWIPPTTAEGAIARIEGLKQTGVVKSVVPTIPYTPPVKPTYYPAKTFEEAFKEVIEAKIPSTTPGYHPLYQSMAIESALKTAKVKAGYKEYAKSRMA